MSLAVEVRATIAAALGEGAGALAAAGIETPALDARLLLGHVLAADQAALIRRAGEHLDGRARAVFAGLIARRSGREPVSRILGRREFYGRAFDLAPDVLDPRPDTETLVDAALELAAGHAGEPFRILDLGTGSGALVVTLLAELPGATGVGVDISHGAIRAARQNAHRHGVAERCMFVVADWDAALAGRFDLIVANPPYIPSGALDALAPEVREHDPRAALDGGPDGLDGHRAVAAAAARLLDPGRGALALEIGWDQEPAARAVLREHGLGVDPAGGALHDLGGRDRVLLARRSGACECQK